MDFRIVLDSFELHMKLAKMGRYIESMERYSEEIKALKFGVNSSVISTGPCADEMTVFNEECTSTILAMVKQMQELKDFIEIGAGIIKDADEYYTNAPTENV